MTPALTLALPSPPRPQTLGRGPLVATSGEDCCIRLWDCRTGAALGTGEAHKVAPKWLVSRQDGTSLLAGSGDRRVWQLDASSFLDGSSATAAAPPAGSARSSGSSRELPGRIVLPDQLGSRVKSMAFDAACSRAAVVLFDSTLSIWDLAAGTCLVQLIKRGERDGTRVHSGGVNEVYLSRDGQRAVSVSKDCTARVWDVAAGETCLVLAGHTDGIYSAALSADEKLLATASYDCTARLWDLASGACLATLPHKHPVTALALAPNASLLVTVTEGPAAWLWDLRTGRCRARLAGHKEEVAGVLFTPDSRYVVSYGQDCTVQVWACDSGRQHAVFMTDSAVNSCCLVSDSGAEGAVDVIVAGVASGSVHFIEVKDLL
jgi:WD40 repeat protein